jgi:hypothetical protein
VLDNIANEAPVWGDINGDGNPELIYNSPNAYGYATYDPSQPEKPWVFHPVSDERFQYIYLASGAGFGDITGNGANDMLCPSGWWENSGENLWVFHEYQFAENSAQMYVYDVDGDGVNDVICVWNCHKYGLVWHKQIRGENGEINWQMREILPINPDLESEDLRVSQMHALSLADINGDGIPEIITGKRFWAHGEHGDTEPGKPAVVCVFKIKRGDNGEVDFIPHIIDENSGVGTQVVAANLIGGEKNKRLDILTSNKKGVYVHYNNSPGINQL